MIIKKITLKNIRSYEQQEVSFPEGSILLSGDIGSGKTSILLGIEFAFFGLQPGQRGTSLLRNGETEGSVILDFAVDNSEVTVERKLKRGSKTVSQDYCAIIINGEKRELSVTELKDKILEILNYPKEFSKKQNLLYKFTVYTPQEEMKQIILEDPDVRLNTLRHVFGIDKYKKIIENISILSSKLREEKRIKEALIENLEEDKASLVLKENSLEEKRSALVSVEKELLVRTEEKKKAQEEKEEISNKIEERNKLRQEVEKTKIMISNKRETITSNMKLIEQLDVQIKDLTSNTQKFDEEKIAELETVIETARKKKVIINEENLLISSKISSFNLKIQESEALNKKIRSIEICPTCLQDVGEVYKSNITNSVESEISKSGKEIETLTVEKKIISESLSKLEREINSAEKQIQEQRLLKIRYSGIDEKRKRLDEMKRLSSPLQKDVELLESHLDTLNKFVFDLNKYENIFQLKNQNLEEARNLERAAEIKVAELRKEIEVFSRQVEEIRESVKRTEEIRERVSFIVNLETWLSKSFLSLISQIEKNVMIKLKTEFSELFTKWFSMLVSDTFEVSLDDKFTPVINYQDYEIDYSYLSGGERTAVALAYRLAFNQVVNSLLSKIKTKDIVILDEPTDGFSDAQLDKMRDVLKQLNSRQLIIVSHEQKIEGFVENVIRLSKEQRASKIDSENFIK
ncbi:MAG: hypothetical protein KJ879_01170 [Nanoarchaeota archaeon]|nr:hypothetical protein [Nanoarchaeota archaeon]